MTDCLDFYMLLHSLFLSYANLAPISNERVVPSRGGISYYVPNVLSLKLPRTGWLSYINKFLAESTYLVGNITW